MRLNLQLTSFLEKVEVVKYAGPRLSEEKYIAAIRKFQSTKKLDKNTVKYLDSRNAWLQEMFRTHEPRGVRFAVALHDGDRLPMFMPDIIGLELSYHSRNTRLERILARYVNERFSRFGREGHVVKITSAATWYHGQRDAAFPEYVGLEMIMEKGASYRRDLRRNAEAITRHFLGYMARSF